MRFQRHERIQAPQRHHSIEIAVLRDFVLDQAVAQATKLEAIEVADELVHELWSSRTGRTHAVSLELLEDIGTITIRRHRREADPVRQSERRRNMRASVNSGGSPPAFGQPLTSVRY